MQHTVILALATMLAVVFVVFVALLWRAWSRSAWRRRWQAAPGPAVSGGKAPVAAGRDDDLADPLLRAAVQGAGTATAAILHH